MDRIRRLVRDNGLSLAFSGLFMLFLAGQSAAGFFLFNQHRSEHGLPQIGYVKFIGSGTFFEAVSSNWQAAVLQLFALITFGMILYQKGAPHSRKPERTRSKAPAGPRSSETPAVSGGSRKAGSARANAPDWLYRNSLGLAFGALFACTFALHVASGTQDYNEQRRLIGQPPVSVGAYLVSPDFWSTTLEVWQAEFFAIAAYMILSIYLRQEGSPESKPVSAPDEATGQANE